MVHKDHGLQNCETIGCDAPLTFELLGGRMLGPNFPSGIEKDGTERNGRLLTRVFDISDAGNGS
jgi:hypothetical protein